MIRYLIEFLGTFFYLSIILFMVKFDYQWGPFAIGLGLTMAIFWGGRVSGGHYNPAVSIMFLFDKKLSIEQFFGYVFCQLLGAILALCYFNYYKKNKELIQKMLK